jgi:hypothetical protein
MPHSVLFFNNTDLPVMVDTWQADDPRLHSQKINPQERVTLSSRVGEWHLHTMFPDAADKQLWLDRGYTFNLLGKFRNFPCAQGEYSWLTEWGFNCNRVGENYFIFRPFIKN